MTKKMYLHFRNDTIFGVLNLDYLLSFPFIDLELKIPRAKNSKKAMPTLFRGNPLLILILKSFIVIYNLMFKKFKNLSPSIKISPLLQTQIISFFF